METILYPLQPPSAVTCVFLVKDPAEAETSTWLTEYIIKNML